MRNEELNRQLALAAKLGIPHGGKEWLACLQAWALGYDAGHTDMAVSDREPYETRNPFL